MIQFGVVTLFPEMFSALEYGIVGRAKLNGLIALKCTNPRDFANDKHRTVDDRPYGGGPGMVMCVEPLAAAIDAAKRDFATPSTVIYLSPQGRRSDHRGAEDLLAKQRLVLVCGRYEGVHERLI